MRFAPLTFSVATLALCAASVAVPATHAQSARCLLSFRSRPEACYPGTQVLAAERNSGLAVINPRSSVWPVLHLALRQVIVTKGGSAPHSKQIHYVFGRIPAGSDPVSLPSTLSPKYVVVDEIAGRAVPTHPVVTGAANHSPPWEFTAFVPSHDLSIIVTTNAASSQVRRIGSRMLVSAAGGKA